MNKERKEYLESLEEYGVRASAERVAWEDFYKPPLKRFGFAIGDKKNVSVSDDNVYIKLLEGMLRTVLKTYRKDVVSLGLLVRELEEGATPDPHGQARYVYGELERLGKLDCTSKDFAFGLSGFQLEEEVG